MTQEITLNLYVDNTRKISDYAFPKDEDATIYFRLLRNKYLLNMSLFNQLTLTFKNDKNSTSSQTIIAKTEDVVTINGQQLVKVTLPMSLTSIDTSYTVSSSIIINNSSTKLDSFSILIYTKNTPEMVYVRRAVAALNDTVGNYAELIKKDKISIPNGLIPLNSNGKILESYLPEKYKKHTEMSIVNSSPHSIKLNEDGRLTYVDPASGEVKIVKKQKDPNPEIEVKNGVVTITTDESVEISEQRWDFGHKLIGFFRDGNGTILIGNTFEVTTIGDYSYYYKNIYNKDYVHYFSVAEDQLRFYEPTLTIFDGAVDIVYNDEAPSPTVLAKIAQGNRDKAYFANNGDIVTNNFYSFDSMGEYTLYWKQQDDREFVYVFTVTQEQMAKHKEPEFTQVDMDITVNFTPEVESLVTLKKYGKGEQTVDWFENNGTEITDDTFTITESGGYTFFYKYRGRNYITDFATLDYSYLVPITDIPDKEEFVFGSRVWTRNGVTAGKVYSFDETPFNPSGIYGDTSVLSEADSNNILYNVIDFYYNKIEYKPHELPKILEFDWSNGTVANQNEKTQRTKVGLISSAQASNIDERMKSKGVTGEYWTSTYSDNDNALTYNLDTSTTAITNVSQSKGVRGQIVIDPTALVEKVPKITVTDGIVTITE